MIAKPAGIEGFEQVCKQCHDAQVTRYRGSLHNAVLRSSRSSNLPVDCQGCHQMSAGIVQSGETPEACATCHLYRLGGLQDARHSLQTAVDNCLSRLRQTAEKQLGELINDANHFVDALTQFELKFPDEMTAGEVETYRADLSEFRKNAGV